MRLPVVEDYQSITDFDGLSFRDGNIGHDPDDLTANIDPKWRLNVSARYDTLYKIGTNDGLDIDDGAKNYCVARVPEPDCYA